MSRKKKSRKTGPLAPKSLPRQKQPQAHQSKKKGKGQAAGQRHSAASQQQQLTKRAALPEGHGQRKPVSLIQPGQTMADVQMDVSAAQSQEMMTRLMQLENDPRLNRLLDKIEQGATLSREDQKWFDATLDEVEVLMQRLGIEDEDDDIDADAQDDERAPIA